MLRLEHAGKSALDASSEAPAKMQNSVPKDGGILLPSVQNDIEAKSQLSNSVHKSCQTEDMSERLRQTAATTFGIDFYDDSSSSKYFSHLVDVIKKLEIQKNIAEDSLRWYKLHMPSFWNPKSSPMESVDDDSDSDSDGDSDDDDGDADDREKVDNEGETDKISPYDPRVLVLHRMSCFSGHSHPSRLFFDTPRLFSGDYLDSQCRGRKPVGNLKRYLKRFPGVIAIVYKDYDCSSYRNDLRSTKKRYLMQLDYDAGPARPFSEKVEISSRWFLEKVNDVLCSYPETFPSDAELEETCSPPYLFLYNYGASLRGYGATSLSQEFQRRFQRELNVFFDYIDKNMAADFTEAQDLVAENLITQKHITKLFRPGDVVVTLKDNHPMAYVCLGWPTEESKVSISCLSWEFDGAFRQVNTTFDIICPSSPTPITSLNVYPLRFDRSGLQERLKIRGLKFWGCRDKKFVGYSGLDFSHDMIVDNRLMVDYSTYRKMHPDATIFERERRDDMIAGLIEKDEPPDYVTLLLPANIYGFSLKEKKWVNLAVEQISEIDWNKQSFDRLVMNPKKKELVKALVSVHNAAEKSTEIIEGKGNGLIVLLHGGPGTGKTLTAETIAEIAEKPLYRVTCGDIGTDPEGVESYLETVLYLGKIWGCVVLLDEADVFLEERTLADLQRNALVTVFLRVLEYYDGILILTSNRVGTFDEAFKSRIQLALHYPTLTEPERRKIWRNFIRMLSSAPSASPSFTASTPNPTSQLKVNIEDLEDHLEVLAKHPLNGRQIRNAVTTAKQLALYLGQELKFTHFERVIEVSGEFDLYLEQAHGHSDDQWARQEGFR